MSQWNHLENPIPIGHQVAIVSKGPVESGRLDVDVDDAPPSVLFRLRQMQSHIRMLPPETEMIYDFQ